MGAPWHHASDGPALIRDKADADAAVAQPAAPAPKDDLRVALDTDKGRILLETGDVANGRKWYEIGYREWRPLPRRTA